MDEYKPQLQSTTVQGALCSLVALVFMLCGKHIADVQLKEIVFELTLFLGVAGPVMSYLGRKYATGKIGKPPVPTVSMGEHLSEMSKCIDQVMKLTTALKKATAAPLPPDPPVSEPALAADQNQPSSPQAPQDQAATPLAPGVAAPVLAAFALAGLLALSACTGLSTDSRPADWASRMGPGWDQMVEADQYLTDSYWQLRAECNAIKDAHPELAADINAGIMPALETFRFASATYKDAVATAWNSTEIEPQWSLARSILTDAVQIMAPVAARAGMNALGIGQ